MQQMGTDKIYYCVILEFRAADPLGVSNTVVELLPRRRREALAGALRQVPPPVDRASDKLLYAGHEDALKAVQVMRGVADQISIQQMQRRNDMETETVYGWPAGWRRAATSTCRSPCASRSEDGRGRRGADGG